MFYELDHPILSDYFKKESSENFSFPAHMHYCYELIMVDRGEMIVTVDGREYHLGAGDAVMVFPSQIHSMHTPKESRHTLFIFAPGLVSAYTKMIGGKVPQSHLFHISPLSMQMAHTTPVGADILSVKGLLYTVFAEFHKNAVYTEAETDTRSLLFTIFRFIQKNYRLECTLEALSRGTGYDYAYLSRYFKRFTGMSFNEYVNKVRISHACYLLTNNNMSVFEISEECGFKSLRSLNRNFLKVVGVTPTEYKKRKLASAK